jgi:hypothetical protein
MVSSLVNALVALQILVALGFVVCVGWGALPDLCRDLVKVGGMLAAAALVLAALAGGF